MYWLRWHYHVKDIEGATYTSSSAVVKRPRDASCLSVVGSNSTKRRVESFIVKLRTLQICHCVQLNALFCCLRRNVEASCHKQFVEFSGNQHRRLLPAMCHNLRDGGRCPPATAFTTPACCSVNTGSQARLRIVTSAYPTCIRRPCYGGGGSGRNIAMPFSMEKLEWRGYPMVKKIWWCLFVLTWSTILMLK